MVADVIVVPSRRKLHIIKQFSDGDATVELFSRSKTTEDGLLL